MVGKAVTVIDPTAALPDTASTQREPLMTYPNEPGYVAGSDTSRDAADSVANTALTMRMHIFDLLAKREPAGMTCDEVETALGYRHQTASARLRELSLSGAIHDTGDRRLTRSGRSARVYRVAERGGR